MMSYLQSSMVFQIDKSNQSFIRSIILALYGFFPLLILAKYVASLVVALTENTSSITWFFSSLNFSQMCCKCSCGFDRKYFYYSASPYIQNVNKNFFVIVVTTQMGLVNTMPDSYLILSLFAPSQDTYEKSLRIFFLMINVCCTYCLFYVLHMQGSAVFYAPKLCI